MHGSTGIEGASPLPLIDIDCSVVNLDARVNALRESTVPRFARGLRFDLEVDTSIIIADIFRAARDDRILALLRPHGRYWDPVAEITVRCAVTGRTLPATHIMANDIRGPEWLVFDAPETVSSRRLRSAACTRIAQSSRISHGSSLTGGSCSPCAATNPCSASWTGRTGMPTGTTSTPSSTTTMARPSIPGRTLPLRSPRFPASKPWRRLPGRGPRGPRSAGSSGQPTKPGPRMARFDTPSSASCSQRIW